MFSNLALLVRLRFVLLKHQVHCSSHAPSQAYCQLSSAWAMLQQHFAQSQGSTCGVGNRLISFGSLFLVRCPCSHRVATSTMRIHSATTRIQSFRQLPSGQLVEEVRIFPNVNILPEVFHVQPINACLHKPAYPSPIPSLFLSMASSIVSGQYFYLTVSPSNVISGAT